MNIATSGLLASFQMGIEAVFAQSQGFGVASGPGAISRQAKNTFANVYPLVLCTHQMPLRLRVSTSVLRPWRDQSCLRATSFSPPSPCSPSSPDGPPGAYHPRMAVFCPSMRPKTDRYGDPLPPGAVARLGSLRFRNGDAIFSVVFSPDGKYLATTANDKVRWWDVATAKQIREFRGHPYGIDCLAISPNGTVLASGSNDGTFRLWDIATGQEICCVQGHVLGIGSMAFSPDGKTLATAGRDTKIRLWNASTRKKAQELAGHNNSILSITFSPNGKLLASGSEDGTAPWDLDTSKETRKLEGHLVTVRSVVISPDGKTLASSSDHIDGVIRLWSVASGKETGRLRTEEGGSKLVFSPDGKTLISGNSKPIVWDLATGKPVRRMERKTWVLGIALSPDGKTLASGGYDRIVHLWDVATGKEIRLFGGHRGAVRTIVFRRGGEEVITGAEDGAALRWDVRTGKETHKIVVRETGTVTPSPDGKLLLCRPAPQHPQEDSVLWETAAGKQLHVLEQVCESGGWAFSPDGKLLATASRDGSVVLWDVTKGVKVGRIPDQKEAWPSSLAFSPDGKTLALGTDSGNVSLWDTASGKRIRQLVGRGYPIGGVAFAPDGRTLAAVDDTASIRLWNAAHGQGAPHLERALLRDPGSCLLFPMAIFLAHAVPKPYDCGKRPPARKSAESTGTPASSAPWHSLPMAGCWLRAVKTRVSSSGTFGRCFATAHACGRTRSRRRNLRACGPTWQAGTRAGPTRRSERWLRCPEQGVPLLEEHLRPGTVGRPPAHRGPSRGP